MPNVAARSELSEIRLHVDHWRPVDGIETRDLDRGIVHPYEVADRAPDAVGSILGPLGEDSDERPVRAATRVPRSPTDGVRIHLIEHDEHFDV